MSEIIGNIDPDERLMSLIVEKLKSGDAKLPTEAQMSEELGISRSLLREKMRYLEANGLIDTIQGSGRFAKLPSLSDQINSVWSVVLKVNPAKLLELLDVRILLEINTLQNAVDRITDEQLQHPAETVARMKFLAKRGRPFVEADREFHATLFSCTGNEFLEDLLTSFWDLYEMSVTDKHHQDLVLIAESHEGVMAAVARHDVDTAKRLLMEQFMDARYRINIDLAKQKMDASLSEQLQANN